MTRSTQVAASISHRTEERAAQVGAMVCRIEELLDKRHGVRMRWQISNLPAFAVHGERLDAAANGVILHAQAAQLGTA